MRYDNFEEVDEERRRKVAEDYKEPLEFLISLDHECYHTNDVMYGMKLGNGLLVNQTNIYLLQPRTGNLITEVRAYRNQVKQARIKGLGRTEFCAFTKNRFDFYLDALLNIQAENDFEREVLRTFRIRNF